MIDATGDGMEGATHTIGYKVPPHSKDNATVWHLIYVLWGGTLNTIASSFIHNKEI